jgi:predicted nuclease of restriction endonuclease-like (RecB) superfamily
MVAQISPEALKIFRDGYNVEFLALLSVHAEVDLHRGLPGKLKDCLIELGRDFCFADSEYPLQVGDRDFALNRLFFHQGGTSRKGILCTLRNLDHLVRGLKRPEGPE